MSRVSFISLQNWWNDLLPKNDDDVENSGKMVLLIDILSMCADVGDKALVFSQSISTLDLIELYLSKLPRPGKKRKCWKKGKDWYRYVYSTSSRCVLCGISFRKLTTLLLLFEEIQMCFSYTTIYIYTHFPPPLS